jgi:hypothetical protein
MPEPKTLQRARRDKREHKAPTTQAGEFIREEMDHIREGARHFIGASSGEVPEPWPTAERPAP